MSDIHDTIMGWTGKKPKSVRRSEAEARQAAEKLNYSLRASGWSNLDDPPLPERDYRGRLVWLRKDGTRR